MSQRAIGIFDSGVGGLTVYKEIVRLPGEELIYLGDTARVPYGNKGADTVVRYALEAANFLLSKQVKLLVVACNTASAVALPFLEERFRVPVIGVIEPGARKAASVTRNGRVGVIGTAATIGSGAYTRAIRACRSDIEIFTQPCPLFVPLVEEGWADHPVARLVAEEYLRPLTERGIDTLVLGCTHYPMLKKVLREVLGEGVQLVDSGAETALTVTTILRQMGLFHLSPPGPPRFFVTDSPVQFERVGGAFLGDRLTNVQRVELGMLGPAGERFEEGENK
ncbi:MAG: glutamate racemase [Desulfuromonadaceae bacterium]|nr:glutamate racemase [Desulfuromonadaceae bacterium]